MELKEAIKKLQRTLKKDSEYYQSWKANIAMAFFDEVRSKKLNISHAKFDKYMQ